MKVMRTLRSMVGRRHDPVDPNPTQLAVSFKHPPSLAEQVARLVRSERFNQLMNESGRETFEEANDFEVGDDYEPDSPHEETFPGQFEQELGLERARADKAAKASKSDSGKKSDVKLRRKPIDKKVEKDSTVDSSSEDEE